jgi:hypothetical protein
LTRLPEVYHALRAFDLEAIFHTFRVVLADEVYVTYALSVGERSVSTRQSVQCALSRPTEGPCLLHVARASSDRFDKLAQELCLLLRPSEELRAFVERLLVYHSMGRDVSVLFDGEPTWTLPAGFFFVSSLRN